MGRSYLQTFMKIKIKLAAPEALHLHTVVRGTEDHLRYILGFLLLTEPHRNFCIKSFPATRENAIVYQSLAAGPKLF